MSVLDALGLVHSTVGEIRFDACIDESGFGTIYRGTHLGRNEPVAIKCLRLSRLARLTERMRASIVARFEEETAILRELSQGTNDIVRCFASGQVFAPATGERVPYMVLEWLDGRSLRADLAERRERGLGGRPLNETLALLESAALAIAYAHTRGIIHRDVKPSNLMLATTRAGVRLKVLDFGLAKILSGGPGARTNIATADGVHLVSVAYCAPEQLSASVGEVGPWTDIYSLSLVMLEMLRGERIPHPTSRPLRPSSFGITVPAAIDDVLSRALSQNPLERPANASIFWSALRELSGQSTPPAFDASALAATAFDANAAAVLPAARSGGTPRANPFTGTLMMVNAPGGGLHLLAEQPSPVPPAMPHGGTVGLPPPRSPLAASLGPGLPSPVAHVPIGPAPPPPVVMPAPLANEPPPAMAQHAPQPPLRTASDPPSGVPVKPSRVWLLLVAFAVLTVAAVALALLRR